MTALHQRNRDMQVRNLSPDTQRAYVETIARFARQSVGLPAGLWISEAVHLRPTDVDSRRSRRGRRSWPC